MDEHTSHELAYKKGYEKGKQDAMKWIPVDERLPDIARRVIVTDGENISFGYVLNYVRKDYNPWCTQYPVIYNKVTHWMPLPTPPNGE